uniref:Putative endonuclease/reverse transcript n=1 Tax=Ixodes ricinus TaxID=34613 RepID=A0A147BD87_IXORI
MSPLVFRKGPFSGLCFFLIFINDLPATISSKIRLFADDCVVYNKVTCMHDHNQLQDDLLKINQWCNTWLMSLNKSKCKLIRFTRKKSILYHQYFLDSDLIETVSMYKYLGVRLTSDLSWNNHIEAIHADSSRTLGFIRRNLRSAPPLVRKMAYDTFTKPKLEYAASIWSPHQAYLINHLEAVQNRAARFILSTYDFSVSVSALKSQLTLSSLQLRRKLTRLCLLHKVYYHCPDLKSSLLSPPDRTSSRLNNSCTIKRVSGSTNAFNQSFLPQAISDWNSLPSSIVTIVDPEVFLSSLRIHFSCY